MKKRIYFFILTTNEISYHQAINALIHLTVAYSCIPLSTASVNSKIISRNRCYRPGENPIILNSVLVDNANSLICTTYLLFLA